MANQPGTSHELTEEIARLKKRIREFETAYGPNRELSRSVLDDTPLLAFRFLPDHRITRVNKAYCAYFSTGADELVGRSFLSPVHDDDRESVLQAVSLLTVESPAQQYEHRVILPGGEVRWQRWFSHAVFSDKGAIVACQSIGEDITEGKWTEMALRESEAFNRALINHLPQRIFFKNHNSIYLFCNDRYAQDLGIEAEDIAGKDDFAYFPAELAEKHRADDQVAMGGGGITDIEEPYEVAGKTFWVQTSKVPFRNDRGEVLGVLGIFADITARKQLEKKLKARERDLAEESSRLQDMNTALKVLLEKHEEDRKDMEAGIVVNVRKRILPYMEKMSRTFTRPIQREYADIITRNLNDVISPFLRRLTSAYRDLTPREIEVACLVHDGKTNKDIADLLNLSVRSVECYRDGIRKKLGLANRKTNLRTYLMTLD